MKALIALIVTSFYSSLWIFAQNESRTIDSKIKEVTVFLQGAQVMRAGKTTLPAGKSELIFKGISPSILRSSIQVKGDGAFTILNVSVQKNYLEEKQQSEVVTKLLDTGKELNKKIIQEKSALEVFDNDLSFIVENLKIVGDQTVKAGDLKEVAEYFHTRLLEIKNAKIKSEYNLKEYKEELKKLQDQLNELGLKQLKTSNEVRIQVVAANPIENARFELSYLVQDAGWYAGYDIRVRNINEPLSLSYKAKVFQSSGEDWKDVKLSLSSANPNENGSMPVLNPWKISQINQARMDIAPRSATEGIISACIVDENNNPVPYANVVVSGVSSVGTTTDIDGNFRLTLPDAATSLAISAIGYLKLTIPANQVPDRITLRKAEVSLQSVLVSGGSEDAEEDDINSRGARAKSKNEMFVDGVKIRKPSKDLTLSSTIPLNTSVTLQQTAVNFNIAIPYSIPTDGKTYVVDIFEKQLNSFYEYHCIPKLDPDAFLTANVTDWQDLNLLAGEMNLFFEGNFMGTSILDPGKASDTLKLSLGRDKNISVTRVKSREYSKKQNLGANVSVERRWDIDIRNNKTQPITIVIEDQFPVSVEKDIEVEKGKTNGATLEPETGKLLWKYTLQPGAAQKIGFDYKVKYPRSYNLYL